MLARDVVEKTDGLGHFAALLVAWFCPKRVPCRVSQNLRRLSDVGLGATSQPATRKVLGETGDHCDVEILRKTLQYASLAMRLKPPTDFREEFTVHDVNLFLDGGHRLGSPHLEEVARPVGVF